MLQYILNQIICNTFESELKRHQANLEMGGLCFHVCFVLPIDHEKEEGSRWVDLLIYAPTHYVAVFIKEGKYIRAKSDYVLDEGKWERLSYHDSCWREDGVGRFLQRYSDRLSLIDFWIDDKWYRIKDVPPEIFKEKLWNKK